LSSCGEPLGRPSAITPEIRTRIAAERKAGRSLVAIAAALNRDGIPTGHRGRQWWPSSVRAALAALEADRERALRRAERAVEAGWRLAAGGS
jgi:hypothetical protein